MQLELSEHEIPEHLREFFELVKTPQLKQKDLCMIPARVAFALQADGFWLRSDVVWAKGLSFCDEYSGSVMPESVNGYRYERCRVKVDTVDGWYEWADCPGCPKCVDTGGYVLRRGSWRPTKAHEMVFMLTKSRTYFCDREAVKEEGVNNEYDLTKREAGRLNGTDWLMGGTGQEKTGNSFGKGAAKRNLRSVWVINPGSYPGAHYAVFPPALVEPCIKASTSEAGVCSECGAQWARVVESKSTQHNQQAAQQRIDASGGILSGGIEMSTLGGMTAYVKRSTLGFRPSCTCDAPAVPATVFDPFIGSGTTALVARVLGRHCIGLDLSGEYLRDQARPRLELDALAAWEDGASKPGDNGHDLEDLPMFARRME